MKVRLSGFLVLVFLAATGHMFAQRRPAIFKVGDDCEKGAATNAVEQSFTEASTISERWSEGNEKVPDTLDFLFNAGM